MGRQRGAQTQFKFQMLPRNCAFCCCFVASLSANQRLGLHRTDQWEVRQRKYEKGETAEDRRDNRRSRREWRRYKFHVRQCQAQKTLDIWPSPVCHLTIIWPWTLLRKCHISPEIHLNFSWCSPNHLTFSQPITNPISGSSLRLDVWNEKWPWAWQCGAEIYVYDSGIWKTESRHWHRSWLDQTEAGAESSFNCSSRQCWVETQWIKRRSLWHLDRSLFWIFLRWMIDTKMFYRLRDKSI